MNSYEKGRAFELIVKKIYEQLLKQEDIKVFHQKTYEGKTGQKYIIDLSLMFTKVKASFLILIECKYYNTAVQVGEVLEFATKIDDIGAQKGIIVSNREFQKGALKVARGKKIALMKVYREGELDPLISDIGPELPEMSHYFVGYNVNDKNIHTKLCINEDSIGIDIYTLVFNSLFSSETISSKNEAVEIISNSNKKYDEDLISYNFERIMTPHQQVNAHIRSAFLNSDDKFKKIMHDYNDAIKKAYKLHKINNNKGAIQEIEKSGCPLLQTVPWYCSVRRNAN